MNLPVVNLNGGEYSPLIDARSDLQKYSSGCRILDNFIPRIYGCIERRPGTEYIYKVKDITVKIKLFPFIYSDSIAYMTEFGNKYIRFYYNGAILLDGITPVEVTTDYLAEHLYQLHTKQIADVMWIVHNSYPQAKLSRTSATVFSLDDITFDKGPFLKRNDLEKDDDVTMTPSTITVGAAGTLTASAATFNAGHVGALFKLTQPRVSVVARTPGTKTTTATGVICEAINIKGDFTFVTSGNHDSVVILERNEDSSGWEVFRTYVSTMTDGIGSANAQYTGTETEDNVQYRASVSVHAVSSTVTATITVNSSTQDGIVRITSITSPTVAAMTVVVAPASTDATKRWAEGAWSIKEGYPSSVCFVGERCVYAKDQTVWLSEVGDYENFEEGSKDADSFAVKIPSTNSIKWIESGKNAVLIGTADGEEFVIQSKTYGEPLTPTNWIPLSDSSEGSSSVQPINAKGATLFVDTQLRKVREFIYSDVEGKYKTPDLTELSEHITLGGITSMAYQRSPDSILWCTVDGSNAIKSFTYDRTQEVTSWANHPIGGADEVESVAIIPGDTEDEIWISVLRTVNILQTRYIERMRPRAFETQSDCYYVDCGVFYDGVPLLTISGLSHLTGETVTILGDGAQFPDQIITGDTITLSEAVSKAAIGLRYTYKAKPMRFDVTTTGGTTHGSIKKIPELVISFYKTLNAQYGDGVDTYDIDWRTTEDYDSPPALFTGDKVLSFDGGFDIEDPVIISGSDPFPCTIRAIIPRIEKTGR